MSEAPAILGYSPPPPAPQPPPLGSTFPALHYPNYRKWVAGASVSVVGTWMSGTTIAWILYAQTGQLKWVAYSGICFQIPMALWLLFGGLAADRFDKRRLMLFTQSLLMAGSLAMAALSFVGLFDSPVGPWLILLLAALRGSVMGFDMPARQSFTLEMVHRDALQSAVSLNSGIFNLGRTIGPAIAGLLVATVGPTICFLVDAGSYLAVIAALLTMRLPPRVRKVRHRPAKLHELKMGVIAATGNPRTLTFMALLAAAVFAMAYGTLLPGFARTVFAGGAELFGYLSAAAGVGAFAGAITVSALCRHGRQAWWIFAGMLGTAAGLTALTFAPDRWTAMGCVALLGFAAMCSWGPSNAAVQLATSDRYRGRVLSLLGLIFILAQPIGGMYFSAIADWAGPRLAVATGAIIALLAALTLGRRGASRYGNGQD